MIIVGMHVEEARHGKYITSRVSDTSLRFPTRRSQCDSVAVKTCRHHCDVTRSAAYDFWNDLKKMRPCDIHDIFEKNMVMILILFGGIAQPCLHV